LIGSLAVVGHAQPSLTRFTPSYGWQGRETGETPADLVAERTARRAAVNPRKDANV